MSKTDELLQLNDKHVTPNYAPLPVVLDQGNGVWVTDVDGLRYLDGLAGYSALNFGHGNERLIKVAHEQLDRLTLTSRAFHADTLAPFAEALAKLTGKDMILPMNTGAEAIESAIKVARRWGYRVKGVEADKAEIIVMDGNFHGRTTTIVSFSTDEDARGDFGPFTPGFVIVEYGNLDAVRQAITPNTVAILAEPIQGEGGVVIPPEGFLKGLRQIADEHKILWIDDEIQSGLGRTGKTFAADYEDVVPDIYVMGKALGAGVVPVSAIAANTDILTVLEPGSHGSTFGGNPLAAAVGAEVVKLLAEGEMQKRATELGKTLAEELQKLKDKNVGVVDFRCRGLWAGVDIDPSLMTGKQACKLLMKKGVLLKDTHGSTIRIAPPIVIEADEIRWLVAQLEAVLVEAQQAKKAPQE